ncbi:Uu.00g103800.m01.CDS01 [Anthostomella pinea]|uniref:Uu.00g103800.m01.CDS01 n=1 Tax=Anthostomella pinea TaxID=933095 RepID=A0AAI8VDN6_9PEZI|nr:Uu.00g103800.m01.CDS01 [Anthostomella pinea]
MWSLNYRVLASALWLAATTKATSGGLSVHITVAEGLLQNRTDGHVLVLFAPAEVDPLDDTDVESSPDQFLGKNVYQFGGGDTVTVRDSDNVQPRTGVSGFPDASITGVTAGSYRVQAFLNVYETVTRSDGSTVSVRFPCGDGMEPVNGPGSLTTQAIDVEVSQGSETIELTFDSVTTVDDFEGSEIGGCSQGNYADTEMLKYVKIRSDVLSEFWNRDMYVGATVLLPSGYDASDAITRYPVIYHQDHWSGGSGAYGYSRDEEFKAAWDSGILPNTTDQPTPKLILVTFRHESPFYDDSYAVNTANIGPYGDAINDELIPYIDGRFNTIAQAYARIQDGGSTGGWESAANLVFRPDLFGACFSSYPDSLDFHHHQDIPLYTAKNAYTRDDGSKITSIREVVNGTLTDVVSVEQENHWELTFGTSSRSALQWDVWNAVFGVQGLNNYPLEPWDKVTGEIFPDAVEYWKAFDLTDYIISNWDSGQRNLGEALRGRMFVYVGSWDNYFLNEGVEAFRDRVSARGGPDWANVTVLEGEQHGGNYRRLDTWDYFQLVAGWIEDHSPKGKMPLSKEATAPSTRGNTWKEVIARGGHGAALARQAHPVIKKNGHGRTVEASVGRWDPGLALEAQWLVDGRPSGKPFKVQQGTSLDYMPCRKRPVELEVTGRKRGYVDETRKSNAVRL